MQVLWVRGVRCTHKNSDAKIQQIPISPPRSIGDPYTTKTSSYEE